MMPKCPLCQRKIDFPPFTTEYALCKNCNDSLGANFFRCYFGNNKIISYQINIKINNVIYLFDSNRREDIGDGHSTYISGLINGNVKFLFKHSEYIPLPENAENIIKFINRILNLKAFT